jgi:4-diphosphocytidyl-2-methyl-D-erithritol synthase
VLLHDAARPLVDQRIIADCVAALAEHDAAGVAVPASDTMVVTADGVMRSMPRRETLHRCQTPQCFRLLGDHPRARAGRGRPRVTPPPTTAGW